jgi:hypothetical protein
MPVNAIVVGMPRSGTSMTAAIFAKAGYFVAEDSESQLRKGDEFNPTGYWEAEPLIQANAAVFRAAGFAYDNTWLYDPISWEIATRIHELERIVAHHRFVGEFNTRSPWVWKDPRLCYTLGYWWPLMDQANTRVLLLKRDPRQIYTSFLRLKWRTLSTQDCDDTIQRVENHIKAAEYAIAKYNIPHIVLDYDDFARDADATAHRISEFFDLNLQTHDLGFDARANHSNFRGKLAIALDRIADHLPDGMRKSIKYVVPSWLLDYLYPFKDMF